jgi:hypothetical protein
MPTYRLIAALAISALSFSHGLRAAPVEQLANAGLEAPYTVVSSTNANGIIAGDFPSGWLDGSRFTGAHVDNVYSLEASNTVSGAALKVVAGIQSGFASGASLMMYQSFPAVAGRTYTARIWLRGSTTGTVIFRLRQGASPFTVRVTTNCAVTTAWQQFTINHTATVSETLRMDVFLNNQPMTLWADEASLTVADGNREWFVSPGGADTNAGTLAAPFQTLARGVQSLNAGDTLWLRAGTYRETLTMPWTGTPGTGRITVAAYQSEAVTITGADVIPGPWTLTTNGIYTAEVGWDLGVGLNNVFVGNAMTHEARTPNYGTGDVLHPTTTSMNVSTTNTDVITSTTFSGKADNFWTGARLHAGIGESWAWQVATVASSTGNSITVDPATKITWWFDGNGTGYLYGPLSLLDADNEWHVQNNGVAPHTLHLRITGQADPTGSLVEMRRRTYTVDFAGRSNITVRGLNLRCGDVQMNGSANVLEQCDGRYLSHFLTYLNGSTKKGGVILSGTGNTLRYCTLYDTAGCGAVVSGTGHTITRNHIHHTDYSATYSNAVAMSGSGHTVTFNTAHHSGRDILTPSGTGHFIAYNDLSEPGQMCKDLGVLYTWGSNGQGATGGPTRIAYNWCNDNALGGASPLIYLDNWCRNYVVDHNVCWAATGDSGIRLNGPRDGHDIYHNTLFNCDDIGTHTYSIAVSDPGNPDPAFWNSSGSYSVDLRNNLFLSTTPDTQLISSGTRDFRPKSGAAAIDSATLIAGYNDTFTGSAPDKGAYETGQPYWMPGVDGWSIDESGIRSDAASDVGATIARANGTLISAGSAPTTLQLYWGTSDGGTVAGAWGNVTTVGTNYTGTFAAVSTLLYNLTPGVTIHYRYRSMNAHGEHWSDLQTVTPSTTLQTAIYPSTDLYIDPIQGVSTGGSSGDTQNTNPADDIIYSNADLIAARSGSGNTTGDRRILMKFDLSALPGGAVATAASLRLYLAQTETFGGTNLRRITQRDWTAANVTYDLGSSTNSTFVTNFASTTLSPTVAPALGWYDLDVLASVNGWLGAALPNYGFAIRGVEGFGSTRRQFTSSRGTSGQRPHLLVSYATTNLDTDNDTLPDEWETVHFGAAAAGIGAQDSDGDGTSNADEYTLGTPPRTASPANLLQPTPGGGNLTLTFTARRATGTGYTGRTRYYDVQTTTDLANTASWADLPGFTNIVANDQVVAVVQAVGASPRFYQLRVRVE